MGRATLGCAASSQRPFSWRFYAGLAALCFLFPLLSLQNARWEVPSLSVSLCAPRPSHSAHQAPPAAAAPCALDASRPHPLYPIQSVVPELAAGYCKEEADVCPSIFLPLDRVLADIALHAPDAMSRFVVNIGSKDGVSADPVYPVLVANPRTGGVFVEAGGDMLGKLAAHYAPRFPNAQPVQSFVAPSNVAAVARGDAARARAAGVYPTPARSLDVLKIDIDGCDCHLLQVLLAEPDGFFAAKVVQIELNHVLPPPLAWRDMCLGDAPGRSGPSQDVWGCSMQAAWDLLRPLGYELLQYDWPDGVFVRSDLARLAFPCLMPADASAGELYDRNYWVGREHAAAHYGRFKTHQSDRAFFASLERTARVAYAEPHAALKGLVAAMAGSLNKRPLWVEVGVTLPGLRVAGNVTADANSVRLTFHAS
jgi:hypothetical protein